MYEQYTRQALPSKRYRELLGSAICVFNSNASFIVENLLSANQTLSWYEIIDLTAGHLPSLIKTTLAFVDIDISDEFKQLCDKRNRIIHSFQVTNNEEQVLATKTKNPENNQFIITEGYLLDFIKENESLCDKLYDIRTKIRKAFPA